jgi:hypothetical protein
MMRWLLLAMTHAGTLFAGFALGVYMLPILTAPPSVDRSVLADNARAARFEAQFRRDLKGSDFLHWGEGKVSLTPSRIGHEGRLSPGPDYKLYLVPEFVEDETSFLRLRSVSLRIGDIRTFDGFLVDVPVGTDINAYNTVLVWCETFSEFITSARYR